MTLGTKIVCSAAIPVALVAATAGSSFVALRDADTEVRRALARVAPLVREVAAAEESLGGLGRLHGRWLAIGDPSYERAWTGRMAVLDRRLAGLRGALETPSEQRRLVKARRAVARYRDLVSTGAGGLRPLDAVDRARAIASGERARRTIDAIGRELEQTSSRAQRQADVVTRAARNGMVGGAAVAGVAALIMASWVARRIVRGLGHLAEASIALERGRLDQPIPIGGGDELAGLAVALETLAANLGERDRVSEDTIYRLGHDLTGSLLAIRDAARALASELAAPAASREQRLALLIGEAASELLRRVDRIDDPLRSSGSAALEAARVALLRAPPRQLPDQVSLDEERA